MIKKVKTENGSEQMQDMQSSLGLSLPTGLEENADGIHWYIITRGHSDFSANKTT